MPWGKGYGRYGSPLLLPHMIVRTYILLYTNDNSNSIQIQPKCKI